MPLDETLLKILVCPEDKTSLTFAAQDVVDRLNQKIEKGELQNHSGKPVKEKINAGLVRQDGKRLYPVIEDIPVMLIEECIDL